MGVKPPKIFACGAQSLGSLRSPSAGDSLPRGGEFNARLRLKGVILAVEMRLKTIWEAVTQRLECSSQAVPKRFPSGSHPFPKRLASGWQRYVTHVSSVNNCSRGASQNTLLHSEHSDLPVSGAWRDSQRCTRAATTQHAPRAPEPPTAQAV